MVVEATGQVAAVFDTAATTTSKAPPLYTLSLDAAAIDAGGLAGGVALPVFGGLACRVLPLPEAPSVTEEVYVASEDESDESDDGGRGRGSGGGGGGGDFYVPGGRLGAPLRSANSARSVGGAAGGMGGLGVMLWQTSDGCLAAATLPAAGGGKVRR